MKRGLLLSAVLTLAVLGSRFLGCDQAVPSPAPQPEAAASRASLSPVGESDWSLKIVQFSVGQADAAVVLASNGDAAIVDMGETGSHGKAILSYLKDPQRTGLHASPHVCYVFVSHYDGDHIGGAAKLHDGHLVFEKAFDQGPSLYRVKEGKFTKLYRQYLDFVGDSNGNGRRDPDETEFRRYAARDLVETSDPLRIGPDGGVELRVLSACGDARGTSHDIDLDPATMSRNENSGSIILLIRYGEFEFLTTGDATSDDWQNEPDTEEAVIDAGAIPGGPDIDVLKVAHHGSDTSSGRKFILSTKPEVAIISSTCTKDQVPKKTSLRILLEANAVILVTGSVTSADGKFHDSKHEFGGPSWDPDPAKVHDKQGTVTIRVSKDGRRYTVESEKGWRGTFSAVDSEN